MINISYVSGDATKPIGDGNKIIPHICNCVKAWGKGFVLAISKRWKEPEKEFRRECNPSLGNIQLVRVENDIWIANMFAQYGIRKQGGIPPIRYEAVKTTLSKVAIEAEKLGASVHLPRIGCGLAGGKWNKIEPIIEDKLKGIKVYVYDLAANRK